MCCQKSVFEEPLIMIIGVNPALFIYFAYGSNLLADNFLLNNKGVKIGIGKLVDYGIRFYVPSHVWAGNVLSVVPKEGEFVIGAIWNVTSDIIGLDE